MAVDDIGTTLSRTNSATNLSSNDGATQEEAKSPLASQLSGTTSVTATRYESTNTEEKKPVSGALLGTSPIAIVGDPAFQSPIAQNIIGVSNDDPAGPVLVSDELAMEPEDVSAETVVNKIAVEEENAEENVDEIAEDKVTAEQVLLPLSFKDIDATDEDLQVELDALESNDVAAGATADQWERTVDGKLAELSDIAGELADADDKFSSLNLLNGTLEGADEGADSLERDRLDENAQDATRKWSAAIGPTADPAPVAATGASGGPAAAAQPAPSSAVGNSTCASQLDARALNILFKLGGEEQAERLAGIFAGSPNDYAKVIIVDFANLLTLSLRKTLDDRNLSRQEKNSHAKKLKSLAKKYISLIESEGLDKKSPFGPFYLGQKDARNQRMNLEAELVTLSGGNTAEGRKTLRNTLIEDTVRPFINARLKEMFGGNASGNTTSLMEKMVEERAQAVLDKISVVAENYSKHPHRGVSVRGLAFGFSLVTLLPELLRKISDDEKRTAAQGENPAEASANGDPSPAANGDPSPSSLPPGPVGGASKPTPVSRPESAMSDGHGSSTGGGTVYNIGNLTINKSVNNSDNRSYINGNGTLTFGHDEAQFSMKSGDDGSDVSSVSGHAVLTEANLAAHDRLFSGGRIAPPNLEASESNSETSESNSETSESDVGSEEGDDANSMDGSFYPPSGSASERNFITRENRVQSKLPDDAAIASRDEVDSGVSDWGGRSARSVSVERSLYGDDRASSESGFDSDAEKSEGASRRRISTSSTLAPETITLQSKFVPSAQGASAIKSVIFGRIVEDLGNGWVQIENDDGKRSWKQMVTDKSGNLKPREFKPVELTVHRRDKYHSVGVKPGALELPHPWADSEWRKRNPKNTLIVEDAFDAAKLVRQQDADGDYYLQKF